MDAANKILYSIIANENTLKTLKPDIQKIFKDLKAARKRFTSGHVVFGAIALAGTVSQHTQGYIYGTVDHFHIRRHLRLALSLIEFSSLSRNKIFECCRRLRCQFLKFCNRRKHIYNDNFHFGIWIIGKKTGISRWNGICNPFWIVSK